MLRIMIRKSKINRILPAAKSFLLQNFSTSTQYKFKQNLPHLPVPSLRETLKKYLRSVQPLLSEKDFEVTKKVVEEFGKEDGEGQKLQALLLEKAKNSENWLEKWWLETAYLGYRVPVVIHSSPGLVYPFQTFKNNEDFLYFVTKLIIGILDFKHEVDNDKIPLEKMGKHLLDMSQYKKFFGTIRVPAQKCDTLEYYPTAHHIIVAHRNHFFRLRLFCDNNERLNEDQILPQLQKLLEMSEEPAEPVGILTSDHRDKWSENYEVLIKDPVNAKSLDIVKRSLFFVCLDEATLRDDTNSLTVAGHQCMHGGGSSQNSGNRWFDKTLQFVIGKDGLLGLCYEHSPSEGQPVAVMTDYLMKSVKSGKRKGPHARGTIQNLQKLEFNLTKETRSAIKEASRKLNKLVADLDLEGCHFTKYGKEFIKSMKFSPDSFLQIAMQYGYYRLHKNPGTHYESASSRKFQGGRTEAIRSCSVESVEFAKAMMNPEVGEIEKSNFLLKAVVSHKKYAIDANNGYGVDRHLLGLKLIAIENHLDLPDFFNDKGYIKSTHFLISSSQVATSCCAFMVFGPTAWDGYGICYNPRTHDMYYGLTSFRSNPKTNTADMRKAFENSLIDMRNIVIKTS